LGKTPKREDFITAAKKAEEIINVLGDAAGETTLDPDFISILNQLANMALSTLGKNTPTMMGAGVTAVGGKMKSTASGFIKGMVSEMTAGIPFAPELMEFVGAKAKGAMSGGITSEQKEMAGLLGDVGKKDEDAGGGDAGAESGAEGEKAKKNGGTTETITDVKEEILGGEATGGGGGLEGVTKILTEIEEHLQFIRDNTLTKETLREKDRLGGILDATSKDSPLGKEKAGGGFLGDLFKKFKIGKLPIGQLFSKAGLLKIVTGLGTTIMGSVTTAFGSTGAIGKGFLMKTGPHLMKFLGPAALLAGLAMAIKDGVAGWFMSEEWGVSKISGALGGLFGGTGEAGSFGNVTGNALKWGLIGAGLGSIVPVLGTGIGFMAGALLGGILGWFGGEKIAKALDAIGSWFEDKWNGFLSIFGIDKRSKSKKIEDISEDKNKLDKEITALEKKEKEGKLRTHEKRQLANKRKAAAAVAEREKNIKTTGFDLTDKQKEKRIKELEMTAEESDWSSDYGIGEAEAELAKMQKGFDKRKFASSGMGKRQKESAEKALQAKKDEVQKMKDELKALKRKAKPSGKKQATGADVVDVEPFDKSAHMKGAVVTTMPDDDHVFIEKTGSAAGDPEPTGDGKSMAELRSDGTYEEQLSPKEARKKERKEKFARNKRLRKYLFAESKAERKKGIAARDRNKIADIRNALSGLTEGTTLEKTPNYLLKGFWAEEEGRTRHQGGPIKQSGQYELLAGEMVMDNQAAAIIGSVLNQQAMDRVGVGAGPQGMSQGATAMIDSSTQQVITNNTIIHSPEPQGPMLPGAGRDHAVSHFRHIT
ncbi:MAG: hypothetical protein VX918_10260, partial [Chloroflexota bacterium]|nr:hypothetical protein [Chloroflexota bacterium]